MTSVWYNPMFDTLALGTGDKVYIPCETESVFSYLCDAETAIRYGWVRLGEY